MDCGHQKDILTFEDIIIRHFYACHIGVLGACKLLVGLHFGIFVVTLTRCVSENYASRENLGIKIYAIDRVRGTPLKL
jgi:hypothetical protein